MVRKKGKGKAKEGSSALPPEIMEEQAESGSEESAAAGSGRKKRKRLRRTGKEVQADKRVEWKEGVMKRRFKNERQVKAKSIGTDHLVIQRIQSKGNDYKKMERLDPGPITSTFLKKSKSRSSAPKESSKAFLTTKPAPKEKKVSLLNKLFLQNVAILKCLWKSEEKRKKDKKERRQLAREVGQLKHELHWHTKYIEGENEEEGVTYVAPPQEELVDSSVDEEEEENGTEEDSEEEDEEGDGDDVED
ncbi:hypothetical protein RHGRI_000893 [Rhododendron griersonianum]|uniref:Uncharacterized protein n=1 Tax=Rhododendron griersonianum TaxID=479676 RepID=A0AAV6LIM4_9ERIC|nr:hypothetical protein RHGRI_000893 [Rhododendron griersonianum]